jgi:Protein of unknown function (DUF3179)
MRHRTATVFASGRKYTFSMIKRVRAGVLPGRSPGRSREFRRALGVIAMLALYPALTAFDLSRHSVPPDQITSTGGSMAGIDAITQPAFVTAPSAKYLALDDRVVGVILKGTMRAYPLKILTWHQVIDDSIAGSPIAVTYCPLTGSAIVYNRILGQKTLTLGTSDRLYDSNLLFFDQATKSLWSQIKGEAIAGPLTGSRLNPLPSVVTPWGVWKVYHPETLVLNASAADIGKFAKDSTARYERSRVMLPVSTLDDRMAPKERVLGLSINGASVAFPFTSLDGAKPPVSATVGGTPVTIVYDAASKTAGAVIAGKHAAAYTGFWFAWATFHPHTTIWNNSGDTTAVGANAAVPVSAK